MVPILDVTEMWGITHPLPANDHCPQKAIPTSPCTPANVLVPLQAAKLAENSLSAGWGMGQGHD